jgi:hypothetical protein
MVLLAEGLCAFGDHGHLRPFGERGQPWTATQGPDWEDQGWGEAWLPMWAEPLTIAEVRLLLGSQPAWRGRGAVSAANMQASFSAGSWPRGVTGYARYGLAQRKGLAHLAIPLDIITPEGGLLGEPWLPVAACAAMAGIGESTWRGYVSRGQAPPPGRRHPDSGQPEWEAWVVQAWIGSRPGPGRPRSG